MEKYSFPFYFLCYYCIFPIFILFNVLKLYTVNCLVFLFCFEEKMDQLIFYILSILILWVKQQIFFSSFSIFNPRNKCQNRKLGSSSITFFSMHFANSIYIHIDGSGSLWLFKTDHRYFRSVDFFFIVAPNHQLS